MVFATRSDARYYVNTHSPEFRKQLRIVEFTRTITTGDTSDDCNAESIDFRKERAFTVVMK